MKVLGEVLNLASGALLGFTTTLICVDVILRIFRSPVPGSYDIVEFLTSIMISLAVLKSFQNGEQISVDIADRIFPKHFIPFVNAVSRIITLAFLFILSVGMLSSGASSYISGETSMTLGIPLYPVYLTIGLIAGLAFLSESLKTLRMVIKPTKLMKPSEVKLGREKA
ncbi:MAG: TRAP transporter small permease [Synergistetes bacterium]|nr:TRAP transporter small permease [Synergistota bacterium]